jgi:hypothetical protein
MECFQEDGLSPLEWYKRKIVPTSQDGSTQALAAISVDQLLAKTDLTLSNTGAWNNIYSLGVFAQYVTQANLLGALPKNAWKKVGWRAISAASHSSGIGIAEDSSIGTAAVPTFNEIAPTPKEIEAVSAISKKLELYNKIADAVSTDELMKTLEAAFFASWDVDMLVDMGTLAGYNFESIDRITGSSAENTAKSYTAADEDLYSIDRSANTWFDGSSKYNTAADTDRDLSESLINSLRTTCEPYMTGPLMVGSDWPDNKLYVTGYDTWQRISELESPKQRFSVEGMVVDFTVGEGVKTSPGVKGGLKVASWDGAPMIRDPNVVKDTLSRLYLLDKDFLEISLGLPPQYMDEDNAFIVGHKTIGLWYGMGELVCTKPIAQGKLRDLK